MINVIERKIILEQIVKGLRVQNMSVKALINDFGYEDSMYIMKAIRFPIEYFLEVIAIYDNTHPKMDELKFISDLAKKYNVDRKIILERIKEVREINNYKLMEIEDLKR